MSEIWAALFAPLAQYGAGELLTAIVKIAAIDLILSGDNAAVIGLAIRHLPPLQRKRAAILGALGAVLLRTLFAMFAAVLLRVPYLSACGGILLIIITFKLLRGQESEGSVKSASGIWTAVGVIIIADLSMAFDNVLAVAGAAEGEPLLVLLGLILSVPLLIWGSSFISVLMTRRPLILWAGGAMLLHTALRMIIEDRALNLGRFIDPWGELFAWGCALLLFIAGFLKTRRATI